MDDRQFEAFARDAIANWPRREFDRAAFEHALGYPWERPAGSFVLRGDAVELLDDLYTPRRDATIASFMEDRHPILSFGANASPSRLAMKFAHFASEADREALILTGFLQDFDVGAMPSVPLLGYVPASLFASPGTAVRAAVVWVTPAQVTQLAWSELSYRLGRLEGARFVGDEADFSVDEIFAFVARLGALCIDGAPVALAAVPAKNRTAAVLTQMELLDAVARWVIGPGADAEALVRATCEDMPALMARAVEVVWPRGQRMSGWSPFPVPGR